MWDAGGHATRFRGLFNWTPHILGAVESFGSTVANRWNCAEPLMRCLNSSVKVVLCPLEIEFIINANINDKWRYKWPSAGNASPFRVGWLW
jgi:hypothetical protein